jgi:hypothetical protein
MRGTTNMSSKIQVPDFTRLALWLSPSAIARVIIALAEQARSDGNAIQRGRGTLGETGTAPVRGVTLTPDSVIAVFRATPAGKLAPGGLVAPVEQRSISAGTFLVQAVDLDGNVAAGETSMFEYLILD